MKCLNRSRASAHKPEAETETSAELKGLKKSAPSSCAPSSISLRLDSDPEGPHNKENCIGKPCAADVQWDDEVLLSSSSLAEDSGYLSLHNSQVEHRDASTPGTPGTTGTPGTDTQDRCTDETERGPSPVSCESTSRCLPVLKFQEEVCRQLAKSYQKSQSYDWTVVNKVAENYNLHNIIGAKMGLEYVDVLCGLLKKDMKHILTMILGLLGESDLINCRKVSKTWQRIIHQDKMAVQRCRRAEQMLRDSRRSTESLSRDFGLSRVVFSCLQSVVSSTPGHKPTKKTDGTQKPSRFAEFVEVAKSLKGHESLRSCHLCGSPARLDPAMERAVCTRASCAFDFCTVCMLAFHGSSPCQRGVIKGPSAHRQSVILPGSTRSKRSIRRL